MSTLTVYRNPKRRSTGSLLDSFFHDMTFPRLSFTDFFSEQGYPTTKVAELDNHYDVTLVAPGLDKKDFNVGVSKGGVSFKTAFKHFRDKGAKTFTWNGKKYTTKLKSEK